uniref:Si:ch211-196f5.2 n=1 Tax=Maylandia zebra TaxID=106582 RepID=A0A3P9CL77_9CICH
GNKDERSDHCRGCSGTFSSSALRCHGGVPTQPRLQEFDTCCNICKHVRVTRDIPMSVTLPIEVQADLANQPFPFLDTTLADLGIQESEVKERVVWVDTKKTQVKNKAGEVRVKAQKPGDKQLQEVLYSTEAHTDRSFCRTGMDILPWKQTCAGENGLTPVQMTMALDTENKLPGFTQAQGQREI